MDAQNPTRKTCTSCGVEKSLDDFHRAPTSRDGRSAQCKDCKNARGREFWQTASRPEHLRRRKEAREEARKFKEENPGEKVCAACGVLKPLDDFYRDSWTTAWHGCQSKCKDCAKAVALEWYYRNGPKDPEKNREAIRRFRERHPGRDAEYGRKWREKDPERARELARKRGEKWRIEKPEGRVVSEMKRRVRVAVMTSEDHAYVRLLRHDPCSYCGGPALPVDHIEPIWHGGAAGWENMTASCKRCNSSKRIDTLLSFLLRTASRS